MRTFMTLAILYSFLLATSEAQTIAPTVASPRTYNKTPTTDWSDFHKTFTHRNSVVQLSTKTQPSIKQKCQVLKITADSITCGKPEQFTFYNVSDIAFIYAVHHPWHAALGPFAFFLSATGVTSYGTAIVASTLVASIPLGFLAFVFLIGTLTVAAFFNYDDSPATILYRSPNPAHA